MLNAFISATAEGAIDIELATFPDKPAIHCGAMGLRAEVRDLYAQLQVDETARSLGADGYLKKPPTREALLAALRQWAG